jgi:hypothetical protein
MHINAVYTYQSTSLLYNGSISSLANNQSGTAAVEESYEERTKGLFAPIAYSNNIPHAPVHFTILPSIKVISRSEWQ